MRWPIPFNSPVSPIYGTWQSTDNATEGKAISVATFLSTVRATSIGEGAKEGHVIHSGLEVR